MRRNERGDDYFLPDLVTHDEAIDLVVDAVLLGSKQLRHLSKKILKAQRRLQRSVDRDSWKLYLALEELVNERASVQMDLLVRWALAAGARSRR